MLAMFWGQRYFIENLLFKYFTLSWKLSKNLDFFSHQIVLNGAENKIVSLHSAPSLQSHPSGNQNQKLWSEITLISVHLPTLQITHISQLREKNFNRLPTLADKPHPKTKENRWLTQICWHEIFSVQLINFHTFCLCYFVENDTTWKNLFPTKNQYLEINCVGEITWNRKMLFNSRQCKLRKFHQSI